MFKNMDDMLRHQLTVHCNDPKESPWLARNLWLLRVYGSEVIGRTGDVSLPFNPVKPNDRLTSVLYLLQCSTDRDFPLVLRRGGKRTSVPGCECVVIRGLSKAGFSSYNLARVTGRSTSTILGIIGSNR